jgi:integrase
MALVAYAHGLVEDLAVGADATSEYARDVWDLRRLGVPAGRGPYRLRLDEIAQLWLRAAAKRWARFRLATKAPTSVKSDVRAVVQFASFLERHDPGATNDLAITREALEAYLPWLAATGLSGSTRVDDLVNLRTFIEHARRHGWLSRLVPTATLYSEDLPAKLKPLPRFLPELVMAQIESEANLARLGNPSLAHLVVVLIETGLRVGDATALAFDTVVVDRAGWPCFRFLNSKMGAEQLVPLSAKAAAAVSAQQDHLRACWPGGTPPLLFPTANANPDGTKPFTITSVARQLRRWQAEIGLCNEDGQPVRATPHQFRHTFGTRTINQGVPQHVVQNLLGHASPAMSAP